MKKALLVGMGMVAALSFASAPVFACGEAKEAKTASTSEVNAQMVGSKASCGSGTGAVAKSGDKAACGAAGEAKMASADKAGCAAACSAEMAKWCNMSGDELAKHVGYEGKVELVPMSIKGMTCGGCESSVTAELMKVPGVVKVVAISYKDNQAMVVVDPAKAKTDALTTAVSNKGYEASIMPAVATTTDGTITGKTSCASKTSAEKAACGAAKEANAQEASAKQPH